MLGSVCGRMNWSSRVSNFGLQSSVALKIWDTSIDEFNRIQSHGVLLVPVYSSLLLIKREPRQQPTKSFVSFEILMSSIAFKVWGSI